MIKSHNPRHSQIIRDKSQVRPRFSFSSSVFPIKPFGGGMERRESGEHVKVLKAYKNWVWDLPPYIYRHIW